MTNFQKYFTNTCLKSVIFYYAYNGKTLKLLFEFAHLVYQQLKQCLTVLLHLSLDRSQIV